MGESTDSRGQWISSQKSYKIDQNRWYIVLKISELVDGIHASVSRHLVSRFGAAVVSGGLSGRLISSATLPDERTQTAAVVQRGAGLTGIVGAIRVVVGVLEEPGIVSSDGAMTHCHIENECT